jgi:glucose-1-phosphate thymidylyltransferase
MIYYPMQTLLTAGLDDIMIVSGRGHAGHFLELLGLRHRLWRALHL